MAVTRSMKKQNQEKWGDAKMEYRKKIDTRQQINKIRRDVEAKRKEYIEKLENKVKYLEKKNRRLKLHFRFQHLVL